MYLLGDNKTNITTIKLLNLICIKKILHTNSKRVTASLQTDCTSLSEKDDIQVHLLNKRKFKVVLQIVAERSN